MEMKNIPFGVTDWTQVPPVTQAGMSYQVADNAEPHRSYTSTGAKLFIVD
jgi:hypothetical protein